MSRAENRIHAVGIGIALAIALVALLTAAGGPAWATTGASSSLNPNVRFGTTTFTVSNGTVREGTARCPDGTRVFGGAWGIAGQHARVTAAGPSRKSNGYLVIAYTPPAILTAGITKETARVDVYAWCAPAGQPIVLGKP
jgi:hypothetical protein